jgi:hypothetical protein
LSGAIGEAWLLLVTVEVLLCFVVFRLVGLRDLIWSLAGVGTDVGESGVGAIDNEESDIAKFFAAGKSWVSE